MSVQKAGSKDGNGKPAGHGGYHDSGGLFLYRDPLIMQFAFEMQTQMGYILTAAVCAIALVAMYMKYMDAAQEDRLSSGSLNRVILCRTV